jgi:hypothetical protein
VTDSIPFYRQLWTNLSYDEWLSLGRKLGGTISRLNFAIGDWLMCGEGRSTGWGD